MLWLLTGQAPRPQNWFNTLTRGMKPTVSLYWATLQSTYPRCVVVPSASLTE